MPGIDSFTKLMLHMNTDFSDSSSSGHAPTVNGATIDTVVKKFGAGSGEFVSASSQWVQYQNHADFNFGTANFTIDFWVRFTSLAGTGIGLLTAHVTGTNAWQILYRISGFGTNNTIEIWDGDQTTGLQSSIWTPTLSTQYHIAIVRDGDTVRFFVAGAAVGTASATGLNWDNNGNPIGLGSGRGDIANATHDGHVDELRISKGIARWTVPFTPPTSEYTTSVGGIIIPRRRMEGE